MRIRTSDFVCINTDGSTYDMTISHKFILCISSLDASPVITYLTLAILREKEILTTIKVEGSFKQIREQLLEDGWVTGNYDD